MFFLPFFFWEGLAAKKSFKGGKECCRTHLLLVVAFCNRNQDVVLAIFYDDAVDFYFIQLRIVYFFAYFFVHSIRTAASEEREHGKGENKRKQLIN